MDYSDWARGEKGEERREKEDAVGSPVPGLATEASAEGGFPAYGSRPCHIRL